MKRITLILLFLLIPMAFASDIQPFISIQDSYPSGSTATIKFSVTNNGVIIHDDVEVTISSELFEASSYRIALNPAETLELRTERIYLPHTSKQLLYQTEMSAVSYPENETTVVIGDIIIEASDFSKVFVLRQRSEVVDEAQLTVYITLEKLKQGNIDQLTLTSYYDSSKKTMELSEEELTSLNVDNYIVLSFPINILGMEERVIPVEFVADYIQDEENYILAKEDEIIFELPEDVVEEEIIEEEEPEEEDEEAGVTGIATEKGLITTGLFRLILFVVIAIIIAVAVQQYISRRKKKQYAKEAIREIRGEEGPVEEKSLLESAKEKMLPLKVPEPSYDHSALEIYVKQAAEKGKTTAEIKHNLLEKGWNEDIVDLYLK